MIGTQHALLNIDLRVIFLFDTLLTKGNLPYHLWWRVALTVGLAIIYTTIPMVSTFPTVQ